MSNQYQSANLHGWTINGNVSDKLSWKQIDEWASFLKQQSFPTYPVNLIQVPVPRYALWLIQGLRYKINAMDWKFLDPFKGTVHVFHPYSLTIGSLCLPGGELWNSLEYPSEVPLFCSFITTKSLLADKILPARLATRLDIPLLLI